MKVEKAGLERYLSSFIQAVGELRRDEDFILKVVVALWWIGKLL